MNNGTKNDQRQARRTAFADGLRALADLVENGPCFPTLYFGATPSAREYIYFEHGREIAIAQAKAFIGALTRGPAFEIDRKGETTWLVIKGSIHGLYIDGLVPAREVCDRRVTGVHRASDGSIHELTEWVIPDEILNAWTGGETTASGEGDA